MGSPRLEWNRCFGEWLVVRVLSQVGRVKRAIRIAGLLDRCVSRTLRLLLSGRRTPTQRKVEIEDAVEAVFLSGQLRGDQQPVAQDGAVDDRSARAGD